MMDEIKASLKELGLSPKEADVYLAMLELGPASVQDIANKAGVNRTTTYVMLEALQRHGLTSTFEKGKKILFAAENPHRLSHVLDEELAKTRTKQDRLHAALPRLLAIFNAASDKPRVRFFEGDESIDLTRQEIMSLRAPIWNFFAVDESMLELAKIHEEKRIAYTKQLEKSRVLMAIKPGLMPPYIDQTGVEIRTIDYQAFKFSGEVTISGDRVYLISMKARAMGFIIENREIADAVRALYEAAWKGATPWKAPSEWRHR